MKTEEQTFLYLAGLERTAEFDETILSQYHAASFVDHYFPYEAY